MTGDEFFALLCRLNMTKIELSREIGIHRVTLQRYQNETLKIPLLLQRYLELRLVLSSLKPIPGTS